MTTYGVMQDRIADELARTDLASNIRQAIQSAIRHYERKPFFFNETRSTLSTSDGAFSYSTSDFAFLDKMVEIYSATIEVSTNRYQLAERDWEYIDALRSNTTSNKGDPTDFAYYGKQLYVYPTPNAARNIIMAYVEKATTLSATTDTNYWMTEGEELIRARATRKIYAEVIKDTDNAGVWAAHEQEALQDLMAETESRQMTGTQRPTYF